MTYPLNHLYYIVNTLEAFYPIANKSPANNTIYSPLHYFPSVSDRWFGEGLGVRL